MSAAPNVVFRMHALHRMEQRQIAVEEVESAIRDGQAIEVYENDRPYPSKLYLGGKASRPIHVVAAWNEIAREFIVITAYLPDEAQWSQDFRRRL